MRTQRTLFISHMVQMKEKDVDYAVVDIETLYPTWFR